MLNVMFEGFGGGKVLSSTVFVDLNLFEWNVTHILFSMNSTMFLLIKVTFLRSFSVIRVALNCSHIIFGEFNRGLKKFPGWRIWKS